MTKQAPTSLRIPKHLQDRVAKWAHEQAIPRNAAYVRLVELGMKAVGPHPGLNERPLPETGAFIATRHISEPIRNNGTNAVNVGVPMLTRKAFNPQPKKGK